MSMPLSVLVPLVVIGLIMVIGAVHFSGGSAKQLTLNSAVVIEQILNDDPDFKVGDVFITSDGVSAIVYTADNERVGLVHCMGQNHLVRFLNAEFIRDVKMNGDKIDLYVNDATLGRVGLLVADEGTRAFLVDDLNMRKSS